MLGPGRYLLGVAELALLLGCAWLGASAARRRLAPALDGLTAQLASGIVTVAILVWVAELLGSFGWFEAVPYLVSVIGVGGGAWALSRGPSGPLQPAGPVGVGDPPAGEGRGLTGDVPAAVALVVSLAAVVHFAAGVKLRLSTGMTGFDSTWYHGPFATGFLQSGDTWGLHFIAPQFLAWFYPANSEALHAVGMVAFGRDILSPLLNLGWFIGCLVAAWCIGRPYRVAPWSLALTAVALSVPALHDQAGEARNDIVGIFFLLAGVAILLAQRERRSKLQAGGSAFALGPTAVAGLSAGLAAGTKLNFLLPAGVLVAGIALVAPAGRHWRTFAVAGLAALVGGGYWYLRNLVHAGSPLPWIRHLGPITLPAPEQALGGREGHSVFGYLTDGSVWSDWFLPGLHHGLTPIWPLLLAAALAGLLLSLGRRADPVQRVAAVVGLAAAGAWLAAPTSASGPDGMPHGFESGLRYLAPALALGLALLPAAPAVRDRLHRRSYFPLHRFGKYDRGSLAGPLSRLRSQFPVPGEGKYDRRGGNGWGRSLRVAVGAGIVAVVIGVGYPVQRHYLRDRYAAPAFTAPGLNAAFAWAQGIGDARIATTSTRQYPLYGRDLSNEVQYVGEEQPHGGFTAPTTCPAWRRLINKGHFDYAITTRDRIEPGKPPYPPTSRWTQAPNATVILRKPPTVIYKLKGPLSPSSCPR